MQKRLVLKCSILAVAFLPLLACKAKTNDWQLVYTHSNNVFKSYISPSQTKKIGDKQVEAWDKTVFLKNDGPMQIGDNNIGVVQYNCANRTYMPKRFTVYTASGKEKTSMVIPDNIIQMQPVRANSNIEAQLKFACSQFGW